MQHLEDLPLNDFIAAVENIATMHASEKLDGSSLWFGIDDTGALFTSREGKNSRASRFYAVEEYPRFAAYNGFRSAHAALASKLQDIKRIVQPGQMVELEILYGRQPNAITYGAHGKSYIAFLRGVNGTPDTVADQLSTTLGGTSTKVTTEIMTTSDGLSLTPQTEEITWQFTGAQRIDTSKLRDIPLEKHLKALKDFLSASSGLGDFTNGDVLFTALGSIPKEIRADAKIKKMEIAAKVMTDFKLPIKKELLDKFVKSVKPALQHYEVTPDEDIGIEGIVLRDSNGNLIKLVDKEEFTTINAFNHAIRNQISNVIKTLDPGAPLDARGGIVGVMKVKIADLLGNVDLARGATAKRIFSQVKGATPEETVKNFAANLEISDFLGVKQKILALVKQTVSDLKALLDDFRENKDKFQLKLKSGKTISITPEIEKRTLLVFAETRRNVIDLFEKIKKTKNPAQLVAVLYGANIKKIHQDERVSEELKPAGLLLEKKYDTDKARYANKDAWTILNIYIATVLMSILIYKVEDVKGMRMLKDKSNYRLTSWNKDMSPLNFWGYPVWRASQPAVKKLIGNKAAQQIFKVARRAPPSASRLLHMDLSFGKDVPIDWHDHRKTLLILQQYEGLNTERINSLISGIFNYENLTRDEKVKILARLFYYVTQFIPTSPLFIRIKAIQDELILNANGKNDQMLEMKLIPAVNSLVVEDAAPQTTSAETTSAAPASNVQPGNTSIVDIVTRAKDVNACPTKRHTVKRRRNPNIKHRRFKKPDGKVS